MASDHYPMTKEHEEANSALNIVLTSIFALEMIFKLIGLGFRGYISDRFNIFDGVIVIMGITEIIFFNDNSNISGITVLRALRLFRIFKLAKGWSSLRLLIRKMIESLPGISYLGLLCLLFMFIYALLGMQLFQG